MISSTRVYNMHGLCVLPLSLGRKYTQLIVVPMACTAIERPAGCINLSRSCCQCQWQCCCPRVTHCALVAIVAVISGVDTVENPLSSLNPNITNSEWVLLHARSFRFKSGVPRDTHPAQPGAPRVLTQSTTSTTVPGYNNNNSSTSSGST